MTSKTSVRPVTRTDMPALKDIVDASGLFPSDMLDAMIAGYFNNEPDSGFWLIADAEDPVGLAFCAPEQMTEGTWNLYLIAVHPTRHGRGIGSALIRHIETILAGQGVRILLVETSGLPGFDRTRRFYRHCGYEEEARIRDFYQAGEDKIVFRKAISAM
ncbi:MAG: GNAT family N-acetyltransferase [Pseudomonadota bacterium]